MKKKSHRSKIPIVENAPVFNTPVPSTPEGLTEEGAESSTDSAGRNGITLTFHQSAEDIDGVMPYNITESYEDFEKKPPIDNLGRLVELLLGLGDSMDEQDKKLADFSDFLLKKYAEQRDADVSKMFNDLVVKIKESDMLDSDDVIIKVTKRYSRYVLSGYKKFNNLNKSKQFAYNKILKEVGDDF